MSNSAIAESSKVLVESLDQEGRGVARVAGKVVFIDGALAGETVSFSSYRKKPSFELAHVTQIHRQSPARVQPRCQHFGVCGGCSMQHLEARAQVAVKQRILEDSLWHIGKVKPEAIFRPIYGRAWGYRERARLSVKHVIKKAKTLVGFHEKRSSYVADMQTCEILTPKVARLLPLLAELIGRLSIRDRLPQIEVAVGERVDVLVLRILQPLNDKDEAALREFADRYEIQFWLQPKGPESSFPFHPPNAPELTYALPEFGITMFFSPSDFTQVNSSLNRVMVSRAVRLLDPQPGERIADFFCGLGNFTLPIARRGAQVLGLEGNAVLIQRARRNAEVNGLAHSAKFAAVDLFEMTPTRYSALGHLDKILVDPPREGAIELIKSLGHEGQNGDFAPRRIVYVSCNPSTLARDAQVLVHVHGYALSGAGVMNMFPHTSHVESIAVFDKS
jgi:23S rRNA (uracil1939-C5)-methyltransferase